MNDEGPTVNTDAQRQALDRMSAELLDKLNTMIAEQEARVQEFSLQQNSLSPLPRTEPRPDVKPAGQPSPTIPEPKWEQPAHPVPPRPRSVTPPPTKPKRNQQRTNQTPPPVPRQAAPPAKAGDKQESSIGCGTIAIALIVISMLVRACG